jgi:LysM repeat protein
MAWSSGKNTGNNKLLMVAAGLGLILILLIALGPGENSGIGQLLSAAAPDSSSYVADSSAVSSATQEEKTFDEFPERTTKDSAAAESTVQVTADSAAGPATPEPAEPASAAPVADAGGTILRYRIKKGDTFFKIAAMFGNKPAELQEINGMEDMNLQADKDMKVKIKALHNVGQGEGLNAIAEKYGVSVRSIKIANGLSAENLPSGTSLIIPLK